MITFLIFLSTTIAGQADVPSSIKTPAIEASRAQRFEAFTEPFRTIEVSASESGRLAEVFVRRGDTVAADQMMIQLDNAILIAQRDIARKEAEGSARMDALIVEMNVRNNRLKQIRELLDEGAGSAEEVKRAEADASVAKLNVDAGLETQQLAKLKLAEIDARLRQRQVRCPIAGLIVDVLKEPGEYVSASAPHVATVVQLDQLRATFYLPTSVALDVATQPQLVLQIEGIAQPVTATVEYVAEVTEADSGCVRVDVLIDNADLAIRSGLHCVLTVSPPSISLAEDDHDA